MAVLNNFGHTLCDAELKLTIKNPQSRLELAKKAESLVSIRFGEAGEVGTFSTEDGSIQKNPDCAGDTKIEGADYFAYYNFPLDGAGKAVLGVYEVELTAETKN